ncbi:HlyD family secretion protein [Shewanella sp. NIFS-20-20]|uniref:HlyD family secretion protein n=1 Tax=Shewanella sp. NIFS-20-20 TaxID=2853806 RepID=UPI001C489F13|nr:HlyD family efflux transporter periplasmic adaptor subunit [Shewanella sp. NIFS-20-20]MBV7315122.1 HlyD family efflux transporter periplasmic adaptor subunit [Shewanella sp. NIFS-20-20]
MKIIYPATSKSKTPTHEKGIKVNYAQSKRDGFRGRWYLLLLLVISPVVLLAWFLARPYVFILAPGIITTEPLGMRAPELSVVSELLVNVGDLVEKDTALIQLKLPTLSAKINELHLQQSQLDLSLTEQQVAILNQYQQRIHVASIGLEKQESLLKDFQKFKDKGLVPLSDMAAIIEAQTASSMAYEQAKGDYLNAIYEQRIEQESGSLAQLKLSLARELSALKSQQQQLTILAPFVGRISEIQVQVGEFVNSEVPLLWLSGREKPVVIAYLEPKYLDYVDIGQLATVKLPTGETFRAQINEPTELVGRLPKQLMGPFDGEKPVLKVTLTPQEPLDINIEGIPVEISFDHHWQQ